MSWYQECPVGFGPETGGTDPLGARTVTGAAVAPGGVR